MSGAAPVSMLDSFRNFLVSWAKIQKPDATESQKLESFQSFLEDWVLVQLPCSKEVVEAWNKSVKACKRL